MFLLLQRKKGGHSRLFSIDAKMQAESVSDSLESNFLPQLEKTGLIF